MSGELYIPELAVHLKLHVQDFLEEFYHGIGIRSASKRGHTLPLPEGQQWEEQVSTNTPSQ